MSVIADLHIHSRFSRATSRGLDFPALHRAALEKGIGLVGTGDFTHPGWMAEIAEQLDPDDSGFFQLKPDLARAAEQGLSSACAGSVRFVLQVEISNIYKKDGRVRKNHNIVFVPTLDAARRFSDRLAAIGNLSSDGRPILGLDARDLLQITLETDPSAFLIPAHIWTPWFSLLGSKSGFESLEECFGDLAGEVFAVETGLSSDPGMNWRVSGLDRLTLISNSDAHSAGNLGREANVLDIAPSYEALLDALRTRAGFVETIEFFPEEGKYHLDGHRKCRLRIEPERTRELSGRCPECGGLITVGVMSRVLDLADRPAGSRPAGSVPFRRFVPLREVIGAALGVGSGSQKVKARLDRVLNELGPELVVLRETPLADIARVGGALMAEAVRRVRNEELTIAPGYDGEFGAIHIFAPEERQRLAGQTAFFDEDASPVVEKQRPSERGTNEERKTATKHKSAGASPSDANSAELDADQARAVGARGPVLVIAGPGTGKTRTLVSRIVEQIRRGAVRPDRVLAVTFTKQAVEEMRERIRKALPESGDEAPLICTFHGLGRWLLHNMGRSAGEIVDDAARLDLVRETLEGGGVKNEAGRRLRYISLAKQSMDPLAALGADPALGETYRRYETLLAERGLADVDDLVLRPCRLLLADADLASRLARRFESVCVDEYQDVNDVQAALIRILQPDGAGLFVIGDPNQSIYGFRGARPGHFQRFTEAFLAAQVVRLRTTYRLTQPTFQVARAMLNSSSSFTTAQAGRRVEIVACPTPDSEAEQIVVRLERLIGGTSSFAVDTGRGSDAEMLDAGFGDVAILSRTRAQRREMIEALGRSGIPCHSVGEDERHDPRSEKVAVMTMHAAKGREFEVVFVTGVERGLMPLAMEGFDADPEEERRLLYVAVTRARQLAVLSHAGRRMLWGRRLPGGPSPFLDSVPEDAVLRTSPKLTYKKMQLRLFS
ncbi:MAG: UvrD-helicase domain-containing protein [Vicinamibacteria bacterium]|nr:UvrD-helicase domain-containing protein [Vicinamibacteria bacterium]